MYCADRVELLALLAINLRKRINEAARSNIYKINKDRNTKYMLSHDCINHVGIIRIE